MKSLIILLVSVNSFAGIGAGPINTGGGKPVKDDSRVVFSLDSGAYSADEVSRQKTRLDLVNLAKVIGLKPSANTFEPLVEIRFENDESLRDRAFKVDFSNFEKNRFENDINSWKIIPKYQRDNAVGCLNALDYADEIQECINYELNSN